MEQESTINKSINLISRIPGIGKKSAQRMVFFLMQKKHPILLPLIDQLSQLSENISLCKNCNNIDTQNPCSICSNFNRDTKQLCIVESISSLWALEKTKHYKGLYFVLGGLLSAKNTSPEELHINKLIDTISKNKTNEVVLAIPLTIEGQTTAYFLKETLEKEIYNWQISITTLARGIPVGGELEYMDELTLSTAIKLRGTL